MFSRALRLPPLTPLWLWSSNYLNMLIVQRVHHCIGDGLGSHRDPLLSFLPVQKYSLNGFAFSSGSPKRRFLIAVYKEVLQSGPCAKLPCSRRLFLSGSALSGYEDVGK